MLCVVCLKGYQKTLHYLIFSCKPIPAKSFEIYPFLRGIQNADACHVTIQSEARVEVPDYKNPSYDFWHQSEKQNGLWWSFCIKMLKKLVAPLTVS